jgi:hypothetical protein
MLVPTLADRGCHVVNVTVPYGRIFGFRDRSRNFFFEVAPQLYSRDWVDPAPDSLLLRKCGKVGNRTRTSGSAARNSDHQTTEEVTNCSDHYFNVLRWHSCLRYYATSRNVEGSRPDEVITFFKFT